MLFPVIRWRGGVGICAGKNHMALTLIHHSAGFLVVVEGHRCGGHRFHINGDICLSESRCRKFIKQNTPSPCTISVNLSRGRNLMRDSMGQMKQKGSSEMGRKNPPLAQLTVRVHETYSPIHVQRKEQINPSRETH